MSRSGSGKLDPVLEGVELLFQQKGGSASFGAQVALSLNGVDLSCMNSITGSTCRAKCSKILHDIRKTETEHCPVPPTQAAENSCANGHCKMMVPHAVPNQKSNTFPWHSQGKLKGEVSLYH